ncbi:hypothetical protein D3C71_1216400 [compost metagenome]
MPCVVQHGRGHARQLGHLDPVAAAGRAGLDLVQEDDVGAALGGAHMHVDRVARLGGQLRQLEIVRGKQREGAGLVVQVRGNAAGQRQAVERAGAPADLVHQHQAVGRGGVQYLRGFGHLQHEGGLRVGQVVGRADAGVDGVDGPQAATGGGHVAADAGQQHDERDLPHVGRFTAHVGAGDDLHARVGVEARVVGDEAAAGCLGQTGFDHGVAAAFDLDAGLGHKLRRAPVQRERAFGECAQHIQRGQRLRQAGEGGHVGLQLVEDLFVQPLLAGQGTLVGRQGLVLEGFQLGGDEALGVFQRLATAVVVGHTVEVAAGHFDIEAVHLVELHAQVGDAGARLLAGFQIQQKGIAVGLDGAQLVQLGVKAVGDHTAVAH